MIKVLAGNVIWIFPDHNYHWNALQTKKNNYKDVQRVCWRASALNSVTGLIWMPSIKNYYFKSYFFSFFTYAFPVFSGLNISAMPFHHTCPRSQTLAEETRMPQAMEFGIYWCGHQPWVASEGQEGQEEARGCVSVRRWAVFSRWGQGRNKFASRRSSELFWCLGSSFSLFPIRTLPFIICRVFGAPWTELPVGLNAPKDQIKPQVSVLELLNLLKASPGILLPGTRGCRTSTAHHSLAQIFSVRGPAWLLLASTQEAHPSLPGTQHLPKHRNSACTSPSGRKVWKAVNSAETSPCHQQPRRRRRRRWVMNVVLLLPRLYLFWE